MTRPNLPRRAGLAACLGLLLGSARSWAHGDAAHKPGPVVKEQKDWGIAGEPKAVSRTIAVTMSDAMRFTPSAITVKQGQTVRFEVHNQGRLMHEFVIGTPKELQAHADLMVKFPNMEHDEPYMAHVPPGKKASLHWQFNRAGEFQFACLIAGHFQAGMVGRITVTAG